MTDRSWLEVFEEAAGGQGTDLRGYYHHNYIVSVGARRFILRVPIPESPSMDLQLIPEREALQWAERHRFPAPRIVHHSAEPKFTIHTFIEGDQFNQVYPDSDPFPDWIPENLARQMAELHKHPCRELTHHCRTAYDPDRSGDLFRALLAKTSEIYNRNIHKYRGFYDKLGVPDDPFDAVSGQAENLTDRHPVMCHCDVHRKNLIRTNGPDLVILDWELTLVADPFYDLAVHFHKMRYESHQEGMFLEEYARHSHPEPSPEFMAEQVGIYLRLERVKSALVDAIRLENDLQNPKLSAETREHLCSRYRKKLRKAYAVWRIGEEHLPDTCAILYSAVTRS